jgi:hypothetical protein
LYPQNYNVEITSEHLLQISEHFKRFTSDKGKALEQFFGSGTRQGCFSEAAGLWGLAIAKPTIFWK